MIGAGLWFAHLNRVWDSLPEGCLCSVTEPEDCWKLFDPIFGNEEGPNLWRLAESFYRRKCFTRTWVTQRLSMHVGLFSSSENTTLPLVDSSC